MIIYTDDEEYKKQDVDSTKKTGKHRHIVKIKDEPIYKIFGFCTLLSNKFSLYIYITMVARNSPENFYTARNSPENFYTARNSPERIGPFTTRPGKPLARYNVPPNSPEGRPLGFYNAPPNSPSSARNYPQAFSPPTNSARNKRMRKKH